MAQPPESPPAKKPPRYRVRASLPDGMFQVSKPITLRPPTALAPITGEVPRPPPRFSKPRWGKKIVSHGDTIEASIDVTEAEGKTIEFVVERLEGRKWVKDATERATVKDGVATAIITAAHSSEKVSGDELRRRKLRFTAQMVT